MYSFFIFFFKQNTACDLRISDWSSDVCSSYLAFVFIFGRRQEALDAAVAELGPDARAVQGSVSDEADLDRLFAAVKAERGSLDIIFANAGGGSQLKLGEITAAPIDEPFDINVKGTNFTVQKRPEDRRVGTASSGTC